MRHEQTLVGSNYEIRAEGREVIRAEGRELMRAEEWEVMRAESQNEGEVKNVGQWLKALIYIRHVGALTINASHSTDLGCDH